MRKLYLAALTACLLAATHPLNGQMILSQPIPKEVAQALEQEQQAARLAARG